MPESGALLIVHVEDPKASTCRGDVSRFVLQAILDPIEAQ